MLVGYLLCGVGVFYFEDTSNGQCVDEQPVPVPDGWTCGFDAGCGEWYFVHVATSECFWDLDVGVLHADGIVAADAELTAKDFVRSYRRFTVKNHPDKGGDLVVFTLARERFERIELRNRR